jgi:uncharacterized protein (TIGR00251 family)
MSALPPWLTWDETGVRLTLRIIPRCRRSEIAGTHGDALKVRVAAPPVAGAANRALVEFLARRLGVRKNRVLIVSGERSRQKRVHISGLQPYEALGRLDTGSES